MSVEEAIRQRLASDTAVQAMVGTRVYQLHLPQQPTLPAVLVQEISEIVPYHLRGRVNCLAARVQTDAYVHESSADAYADAVALAQAIDDALSGQLFASMGSPPGIEVLGCFRVLRLKIYEPEELRTIRMMQDYTVIFRQTG